MTEHEGRHCERCRLVNWVVFDTFDGRQVRGRGRCPMPNVCKACDEWEMEHDETLVLPRVGEGDDGR